MLDTIKKYLNASAKRAKLERALGFGPGLSVPDGKCAGGEVPPLDGSQCAKCGATENDFCPYEKP
jgi:hypothetical protein